MPIKTYQRYLVAVVPLLIFGVIAYYFSDILTYIVLAWILSMVGAPLHTWLSKYIGSNLAAVATLFAFALVLVVVVMLFIPPVVQQARNLSKIDYNAVGKSLEEPLADWNDWLAKKGLIEKIEVDSTSVEQKSIDHGHLQIVSIDSIMRAQGDTTDTGVTLVLNIQPDEPEESAEDLAADKPLDFAGKIREKVVGFINPARITDVLGAIVGFLGNVLITIMSVFFIAFFFLKERGLFSSMIKAIVPNNYEGQSLSAIDESAGLLMRYFIGILVQITMITIFVSTLLGILGIKNALLIALFAALFNVVPYIGPFLGAAFGMIILISANVDVSFYDVILPKIFKLIAVFASMQLLDNFILQPNIFSRSVKAHPLEIFLVVLIGAKLGGVVGMVIAIPVYTVIRVLAKVFFSEFKIVQSMTRGL